MNRVQRSSLPQCALFAASTLLLASCGGIEGTGSPQAAIEGTGIIDTGTVTGFGSVFVNGVEFATDRAAIVVDGTPVDESALQVGMVVVVTGSTAADGLTGTASRVEFDRALYGPIDVLDSEARSVTVLGQRVQFDDASLFDETAEEALAEGQACLVTGHADGAGVMRATLMRCAGGYVAGASPVEREAVVSQLDTGAARFQLGELTVGFANAAMDTGAGPLADGALVEAIGLQPQRDGVLQAQRIRVKGSSTKPGQALVLEGVIGRFAGLADFELGRQRVDASSATRADTHGALPATGLRALVAGVVRADGVIAATRYALLPATDILFTGRVDAVDTGREVLTLFGDERHALAITQYQDRRANGRRRFRLRDLSAGDYVQLRGFRDPSGRAVITRVEQRDEEEPDGGTIAARLRIVIGERDPAAALARGPLDSFDLIQSRLVIAGVPVHTDNAQTAFSGRNGETLTSPQFYSGLRAGDRLEVEGNEASDVIEAVRVSYAP